MSAERRPSDPSEARRASFLVPRLAAVVVTVFSLTLLTIGARSPYTHANLQPGHDPGYTRTEQIHLGPAEPYGGRASTAAPTATGPAAAGARLFVTTGCAACHALEGRGGAVGPPIVGTDEATVREKARRGPSGMPRYSQEALSDEQIAAIAEYLRSLTATPAASPAR